MGRKSISEAIGEASTIKGTCKSHKREQEVAELWPLCFDEYRPAGALSGDLVLGNRGHKGDTGREIVTGIPRGRCTREV